MTAATEPIEPIALFNHRHRITVAEYHRMVDSGVFGSDPRVELVEGVILEKTSKNPPHVITTDLIQYLLMRLLPVDYHVTMGNPVSIEERDSEPEPDAMIVRGSIRDYAGRRRTPADAAVIVEVADSSYDIDRFQKSATYAAAGVPVYWLVDLNRNRLELHSEPAGEGDNAYFARTQTLAADDEVSVTLDGREVARFFVKEILP